MKVYLLLLVILVLSLPLTAEAVSVDLNKATLAWNASVVDATHGAPTSYNVKCGATTGSYNIIFSVIAPAVTVPVSSVVPLPGTYFCVVSGVNAFGESGVSNEVNFTSGYGPTAPTGLTVK